MTKLFYGLTTKLIKLLSESEKIFYEEHAFLLNKTFPLEITTSSQSYQNKIETEKTIDALLSEIENNTSVKTYSQANFLVDK